MRSRRNWRRDALAWAAAVLSALAVAGFLLLPLAGRGSLRVNFFNVGQGDAILVTTPGGSQIVVDGGPDNTLVHKVGAVLPVWDRTIELVVLTHPHADHLIGLISLARRYRIRQLVTSGAEAKTPEFRALAAELARQGVPVVVARGPAVQRLEPRLELRLLYPAAATPASQNPNDASLVLQLAYGDTEVLLMGDLEAEAQAALPSAWLKSDGLKVAHHGSADALNLGVLAAIRPAWAVISVGKNSYGHPSPRVRRALERLGARVLATQDSGDVTAVADGRLWRVNTSLPVSAAP